MGGCRFVTWPLVGHSPLVYVDMVDLTITVMSCDAWGSKVISLFMMGRICGHDGGNSHVIVSVAWVLQAIRCFVMGCIPHVYVDMLDVTRHDVM